MARLPKATARFFMRIAPMEYAQWKRWARLERLKVSMMVRQAVKDFGRRAEKKVG